ncbi:MAG: hypothetical protein U1F98_02415 [Verrucomicrobiota bacterium]
MRAWILLLILTAAVFVQGCATGKSGGSDASAAGKSSAGATAPVVTPDFSLVGRVTWVNKDLQFVVITFPLGQMPPLDRRMAVYRGKLKVGEVRITGPQGDDNIVGDITAGEAGMGDTIR